MSSHSQCDTALTIRYHTRPAPFPSGCLCVCVCKGKHCPCFYDKDVTFPALCVCVSVRVCLFVCIRERQWRESRNHDSTTARHMTEGPHPVQIPQMGFNTGSHEHTHTHTHTHTQSESHFACQGLITLCVVQLEYYPQGHCKMVHNAKRLKVTDFIILAADFSQIPCG